MRDINRRLDALQRTLSIVAPCKMKVELITGEIIVTDPVGAWEIFKGPVRIKTVEASQDSYAELAALLTALCV